MALSQRVWLCLLKPAEKPLSFGQIKRGNISFKAFNLTECTKTKREGSECLNRLGRVIKTLNLMLLDYNLANTWKL